MTNNLPENDDAPWLNLTPQEVEELRYNKQNLTEYGREKIRALMEEKKLLKECRQTGRTTATTEKVLKTVFSQMTDKKTLECEIEEYALEIEQKAKEIGKLKDILDRKEQQLKQMKETDISKVLIEGDTATIMGVKYKRVEEPPKTLTDLIYRWWSDVFTTHSDWDMETSIEDLVDQIQLWLPKEQSAAGSQNAYVESAVEGFNDCLNKIKRKLR